MTHQRDHGGDLDRAKTQFGAGDWIDLSTGINAQPYPVGEISAQSWATLPTHSARAQLEQVAAQTYATKADVIALSGAQMAIQTIPALITPGVARVLSPTYNEHAAALRGMGWKVEEPNTISALEGADLAVIVNPNNPDGQRHDPQRIADMAGKVGLLVVDESFIDMTPAAAFTPHLHKLCVENIIIMRSFGKFYGLAGARLGFAITGKKFAEKIRDRLGPWPLSGPAIEIGMRALQDHVWAEATRQRLNTEAGWLDRIAHEAGWEIVGGTALFRTYATPDAKTAQCELATAHIWSRIFPYSGSWLRLGLPGRSEHWDRLTRAVKEIGKRT